MQKRLPQIIENSGLNSNPGYYDGRNIKYGDIKVEHIKKISDGIAENFGKTEQEVFHEMIFDLPTLKPTYFLSMLYRLQMQADEKGWRWKKHVVDHYAADLGGKIDEVCPLSEQLKTEFKKLINPEPIQK